MYHAPKTMEVVSWFHETFGDPLEWGGEVLEPVKLKGRHQWANGKHRIAGSVNPTPMIWCTEKAYTLYTLRWH